MTPRSVAAAILTALVAAIARAEHARPTQPACRHCGQTHRSTP